MNRNQPQLINLLQPFDLDRIIAAAARQSVAADQAFANRYIVADIEAKSAIPVLLFPDLPVVEQYHHLAVRTPHDVGDFRRYFIRPFVG